jgi:ketosteroid isomerase-like protein
MRGTVTAIALALTACATSTPPPAAPRAAADERCAVWNREVEFAHSVRDHDAGKFTEHVQEGAVFVTGDSFLRGRDAILKEWRPLLAGDRLHIGWYPTTVIVTGDSHVALSRGPFWLVVQNPDGSSKFLTGIFQSVWVKDADGAWRVTIDGGTAPPSEASEPDVQKLKAAAPSACPPGS